MSKQRKFHYVPASYIGLFSDTPQPPLRKSLISSYEWEPELYRPRIRNNIGAGSVGYSLDAWSDLEESANAFFERELPHALLRLESAALGAPPQTIYDPSFVSVSFLDLKLLYVLNGITRFRHPFYDLSVDKFIRNKDELQEENRDAEAAALLRRAEGLFVGTYTHTILVINDSPRPLNLARPFFTLGGGQEFYHVIPVTPRVTALVVEGKKKDFDPLWRGPNQVAVFRQNFRPVSHLSHIPGREVGVRVHYIFPTSATDDMIKEIQERESRPPHHRLTLIGSRLFVVPRQEKGSFEPVGGMLALRSDRRDFEYMRGDFRFLRSAQYGLKRVTAEPLPYASGA